MADMTENAHPPTAQPANPYGPAEPGPRPTLRRNPLGVAALITAGVLVVAQAILQAVVVNAAVAGDPTSMYFILRVVQPVSVGLLSLVTAVLGAIAAFLPGRVRLAAGIGLGVGAYSLIAILIGFVTSLGYSLA